MNDETTTPPPESGEAVETSPAPPPIEASDAPAADGVINPPPADEEPAPVPPSDALVQARLSEMAAEIAALRASQSEDTEARARADAALAEAQAANTALRSEMTRRVIEEAGVAEKYRGIVAAQFPDLTTAEARGRFGEWLREHGELRVRTETAEARVGENLPPSEQDKRSKRANWYGLRLMGRKEG